MTNTKYKLV